ncbi:MAG: hypothetical protein H6793_02715 [Candidatus Nomurabacteria bacterium]|nr:hypothetical protein [Candidatus Saccharibacteria bacterium]USN95223.1 MAG: hypothetical protein H6793_02715 [Candidatus Nomurabacteria bacterium]
MDTLAQTSNTIDTTIPYTPPTKQKSNSTLISVAILGTISILIAVIVVVVMQKKKNRKVKAQFNETTTPQTAPQPQVPASNVLSQNQQQSNTPTQIGENHTNNQQPPENPPLQ